MVDRDALLASDKPSQGHVEHSMRHHRRRRSRDEESSGSSADSSSEEDDYTPSDTSPTCTSQRILLGFLVLLLLGIIGFVVWLLRRGRSDSSMATSDTLANFQDDAVAAHNDFRATHNASALEWNATLADAAKRWSKKCQWKHSLGSLLEGSYGENLFASSSTAYKADDNSPMNTSAGVWAWNNEETMYDYSKPTGFTEETGHFTQTVWKSTTSVGCYFQMCLGLFSAGEYGVYLVCEYHPAGNIVSEDLAFFKENVQAPSSS
ncbi:hypothetical protein JCM6882_006631 [Rhodosporidiobolus microsporus]